MKTILAIIGGCYLGCKLIDWIFKVIGKAYIEMKTEEALKPKK